MKIIAVGMNYALHNKELGHTHENKEPVIFLKPDSAILKDGKPFFIPDFSNEVHYETEVVVRICRLGKNIAPRFAHRYYDAVTVGIDFTARDLQRKFREAGNPWELCKGFDNSAAIGTFVPLEQVGGNVQNLDFHLTIDDKEVQRSHTSDMLFQVDEIIAYLTCRARPFVFSTFISPHDTAAAYAALQVLQEEGPILMKTLREHTRFMREGLHTLKLPVLPGITPLIPIIVGSVERAAAIDAFLKERGILLSAIRPPSVPMGTARLRLTLSAAHTKPQLQQVLSLLKEAWQQIP